MPTKKRGTVETPKLTLTKSVDGYAPQPKPDPETCGVEQCPYVRNANYNYYGYGQAHSHYQFGELDYAVTTTEEIVESYSGIVYKWLGSTMQSTAGGVPIQYELGKWMSPDKNLLSTCNHGLHALLPGQYGFRGPRLFIAEADGPIIVAGKNGGDKILTGRLRVLSEVDQTVTINPEAAQASWLKLREMFISSRYNNLGYTNYYNLPKRLHHLIRGTAKATVAAIRKEARPMLAETRKQRNIMLRTGQAVDSYPKLTGRNQNQIDWNAYNAADNERVRLRRKLRELEAILVQIETYRPTPAKGNTHLFTMSPEYKAFIEAEFEMPQGGA